MVRKAGKENQLKLANYTDSEREVVSSSTRKKASGGTKSRTWSGDLTRKSKYSAIELGGSLCTSVWYFLYKAKEICFVRLNSLLEVQTITS